MSCESATAILLLKADAG